MICLASKAYTYHAIIALTAVQRPCRTSRTESQQKKTETEGLRSDKFQYTNNLHQNCIHFQYNFGYVVSSVPIFLTHAESTCDVNVMPRHLSMFRVSTSSGKRNTANQEQLMDTVM